MGKPRSVKMESVSTCLPPPPPLLPRPDLLTAFDSEEPLDYSMKHLQSRCLQQATCRSPSPTSMASSTSSPAAHQSLAAEEVLHRLRHSVMQRQPKFEPDCSKMQQALNQIVMMNVGHLSSQKLAIKPEAAAAQLTSCDSDLEAKAAFAAECIKSRLDGCGKRVHLFLGILLHFGMPPGRHGEQVFPGRVIAFSDEHKSVSDKPTPYFMVLDSKILALIWCKFKSNSSSEYSTLTRAIRSTRQKYRGIFEAVENPGKKLYKFGPVALEQFRALFPGSYVAAA